MKKRIKYFIVVLLLSITINLLGQGTSCGTALNIGTPTTTQTCQTLNTTGSGSAPCNGSGYGGSGGYYYFQFCTNATNDCIMFDFVDNTTDNNWAIRIYDVGCTTIIGTDCIGNPGTNQPFSTNSLGLLPSTCYTARVWVKTAGSFDLCYQTILHNNDSCNDALPISSVPQTSDNICAGPGPTTNTPIVTPGDLCAGSLENTSWYSFTTLSTADVILTINNISCTGGASGFQIGFFTGSCGTLNNFGCVNGSGGNVTVTINGLSAGDVVTIAIDGNAGANCTYDISATNTYPLPVELINFDCEWEGGDIKLSWVSASELNNSHYIIDHSTNGYDWDVTNIISGAGSSTSVIVYSVIHYDPVIGNNYYRLTQVDFDGKQKVFNTVSCEKHIDDRLIKKIEYYNILGQKVNKLTLGLVIIKTSYKNGGIIVEKIHRVVVSNN